jgi:hypothetical protein
MRFNTVSRGSVLSVTLALVVGMAAYGQIPNCYKGTVIPSPTDRKCRKLPVSLPCLDTDSPVEPGEVGYTGDLDSQCGFRRKWAIFPCSCGRPQATEPCTFDGTPG